MQYDYDLFVLGAGSGGVRASRVAASLGAKVGICEDRFFGGTCVNVGCVPKKLMVLGSRFRAELQEAKGFGWSVSEPTHDWAFMRAQQDRELARLQSVYERLLRARDVTIHQARGSLVAPHTVELTEPNGHTTRVTARYVLVAVGGKPVRPTFPGAEETLYSDQIFALRDRPKKLVVLGGGYIAVEFAGIFAGFGSEVELVYRGPLFLRGFDREVRTHLASELQKKRIALHFHREITAVERRGNAALHVRLSDGSVLETEAVLAAIGRVPNTRNLGLEGQGVALDPRGAIRVDRDFRTSVPWLYAVGDVLDRVTLTPVALAEGMYVAQKLFGKSPQEFVYDAIPSAVFSDPPVGTVGLTEQEARAEHASVDVYKSTFTPMKQSLAGTGEKTFMKLVVEAQSQRVLGVHIVGADAPEIVQGFAVAVRCGLTKAQLDSTIGLHPTAAEELVTMRERCPDPDHVSVVAHHETPDDRRRIVHHRWDDESNRS